MTWNDERIAELKKLWDEGLSASAIGERLGISKNAVVGKAHRLKLPSRPSPIKRGSSSSSKPRRARKVATAPRRSAALARADTVRHESPATRSPRSEPSRRPPMSRSYRGADSGQGCLWPIGDPGTPEFHFCGADREEGRPYCSEHVARAYITRKGDSEAA
jgi:GcrA cell cycle regulator